MPSENVANRLPSDALDAFLDGILAELRDPADPIALNEIRAAFRKRVPFNLRSYAAAALILIKRRVFRARPVVPWPRRRSPRPQRISREYRRRRRPPIARCEARNKRVRRPKAMLKIRRVRPRLIGAAQPSRPRFVGEGVTLFFSMGKRQRLYPRILIDLLIDVGGLEPDSIGEVRAFDNYSFADLDPQKSAAAIAALDGYEFRGRKLSVGPAKKRDGQAVAD